MRLNDDVLPTAFPVPSSTTTVKKYSSEAGLFGRSRSCKFWALAAITLLAVWSMFTGSLTLKWSAGNLTHFSDGADSLVLDDLDILEVEEREKVVMHMWGVYTQSKSTRLPRFWQEAFEAAYEHLASDVQSVRDAAVSEIAKMSMRSLRLDPLPTPSKGSKGSRKSLKQAKKGKEVVTKVGSS
ncbi:hypothetical protein FH972_018142 [Carpinus fangiana]|uniref:Uncharacterized protein n=1 Tax=Carpinus fangiana TaxID=176857 RepID=A0A5N6RLK1_9ROSI|nr:hypothetical protein FH972_018142 [Carpinus fangiana]